MRKDFKRVIEQKIQEVLDVGAIQFGFLSGKSTMDAIFIAHPLQERYLEKRKKLLSVIVELKKAFDWVPREVVKWAMRKLGVDE